MIILGHFLNAVAGILGMLVDIFIFLFIACAVLSWVSPDPNNPIVQFIRSATDPILTRIRAKIKPIGMFDLSVIIAIAGLYFIEMFVVATMHSYAARMIVQGGGIIGGQ